MALIKNTLDSYILFFGIIFHLQMKNMFPGLNLPSKVIPNA